MVSACKYCDDIDNIARTLKQDIASKAARKRLAAREPTLVKKIDSGEKLTDNELDVLWKEENRSDAIDVMYGKKRDLIDNITERAIKSGDEAKISKVNDEIKKTTEICVRKGECGTDIGLAIGLGAIATVGILGEATGDDWIFDKDTDAFYKIVGILPDDTLTPYETFGYGTPTIIADAWAFLHQNNMPDSSAYEFGPNWDYSKIQTLGMMTDPTKFVCTDYTRLGVKLLNSRGNPYIEAYTLIVRGDKGDHALILLADKRYNNKYIIDPLSGIKMAGGKVYNETQMDSNLINAANNITNWWTSPALKTQDAIERTLMQKVNEYDTAINIYNEAHAPKTVEIPTMVTLEPQQSNAVNYDFGDNIITNIANIDNQSTFVGRTDYAEIQKGNTRETYISPSKYEKTNDMNAVIPVGKNSGWYIISLPDGTVVNSIDDLDTFGNIETKRYAKDTGLLQET